MDESTEEELRALRIEVESLKLALTAAMRSIFKESEDMAALLDKRYPLVLRGAKGSDRDAIEGKATKRIESWLLWAKGRRI